jgi:hypothetical protein
MMKKKKKMKKKNKKKKKKKKQKRRLTLKECIAMALAQLKASTYTMLS